MAVSLSPLSRPTSGFSGWSSYLLRSLGLALGMALISGWWWQSGPGSALPIWLGWGLSVGLLVRFGRWAVPAVFLTLVLVSWEERIGAWAAVLVAGQLASLSLAAWCLRRLAWFNARLETYASVVALTAMASWTGFSLAALQAFVAGRWDLENLFEWARAGGLGVLVGTPLVLLDWAKRERPWSGRETFENLLWLCSVLYFSHLVFSYWPPVENIDFPLKLALFPVLIWAALRFGPSGVALGMLGVSVLAWVNFDSLDQDAGSPLSQAWTFVGLLGVSALLLAAIFTEMRRREERAAANEARLRALVGALPDSLLILGPAGVVEEVHLPTQGGSCTVVVPQKGSALGELFGPASPQVENLMQRSSGVLNLRLHVNHQPRHVEVRAVRMSFGGTTSTLLLLQDQTEIEVSRLALRTRDVLLAAGARARHHLLTEPDEATALELALGDLAREAGLSAVGLWLPAQTGASRPLRILAGEASAAARLASLPETCGHGEIENAPLPPDAIRLPLRARGAPEGWLVALPDGPGSPCLAHPGILAEIVQGMAAYLENRRAERDLRAARERADAANSAKSEFLAMMSHEIRTPLNAVIGYADLLAMTALQPEQKEHVRTINRSAGMLLELIGNILDYSKIESRAVELATAPFDLEEVALESLDLVSIRARDKGLKLRFEFSSTPGNVFLGDAARLRQVLLNLLMNAVKFTRVGEVVLSVEVVEDGRPGLKRAVFAVRDTGIGIPQEKFHRLFRPFSQVDASTTREFGGTGLGLAIAFRLVERMGGLMTVESEPGQGSLFQFSLILKDGPVPSGRNTPSIFLLGRKAAAGLRLLFVDDDETNLQLGDLLLRELGTEPDLARNGLEALEFLRATRYDGVFLDLQMPKLDGLETARRLRAGEAGEANRGVFVCAVTAFVQPSDREAVRLAGMDDFLPKPMQRKQFLEVLAKIRPQA